MKGGSLKRFHVSTPPILASQSGSGLFRWNAQPLPFIGTWKSGQTGSGLKEMKNDFMSGVKQGLIRGVKQHSFSQVKKGIKRGASQAVNNEINRKVGRKLNDIFGE